MPQYIAACDARTLARRCAAGRHRSSAHNMCRRRCWRIEAGRTPRRWPDPSLASAGGAWRERLRTDDVVLHQPRPNPRTAPSNLRAPLPFHTLPPPPPPLHSATPLPSARGARTRAQPRSGGRRRRVLSHNWRAACMLLLLPTAATPAPADRRATPPPPRLPVPPPQPAAHQRRARPSPRRRWRRRRGPLWLPPRRGSPRPPSPPPP